MQRTVCHAPFKGVFCSKNIIPFSWAGSRGNPPLTHAVGRCFFNLFCLFEIGGWLYGLGRRSKSNAVFGTSSVLLVFSVVWLFLKSFFVPATFGGFGQSLFTNGVFFSNK